VAASADVWDSLRDDTKAYLTLAASVLAVSAAFAGQLVKGDAIGRSALIAAWAVLAAALFSGFQAQASAFGGLTAANERPTAATPPDYSETTKWLDRLLRLIAVALVAMAVAGWRSTLADDDERSAATVARTTVASMTGSDIGDVSVSSISGEEDVGRLVMVATDGQLHERYEVTLDASTLAVVTVDALPRSGQNRDP
jgi:hypothetical protein